MLYVLFMISFVCCFGSIIGFIVFLGIVLLFGDIKKDWWIPLLYGLAWPIGLLIELSRPRRY